MLLLVLRSQFLEYLPETWYNCLGAPESGSLRKEWENMYQVFGLRKRLTIIASFKACDWSGRIFGASASPRSSTQNWLWHPLSLFIAVSTIQLFTAISKMPNVRHFSCYCMRHSRLTRIGLILLNQIVRWHGTRCCLIPFRLLQYCLFSLYRTW